MLYPIVGALQDLWIIHEFLLIVSLGRRILASPSYKPGLALVKYANSSHFVHINRFIFPKVFNAQMIEQLLQSFSVWHAIQKGANIFYCSRQIHQHVLIRKEENIGQVTLLFCLLYMTVVRQPRI